MIDMHSAIAEHNEEIVAVWYRGFKEISTKEEVFIQGMSASMIASDSQYLLLDNSRFQLLMAKPETQIMHQQTNR